MDRSGAPALLSASRRPMSAGPWTGMSSAVHVGPAVRHASASSSKRVHSLDSSAKPTHEMSAAKVSLQYTAPAIFIWGLQPREYVWGTGRTEVPSGVQGRSPGRESGGLTPRS